MYLKKITLVLCTAIFGCRGAENIPPQYSPAKSPRTPKTSRFKSPRASSSKFWGTPEDSPASSVDVTPSPLGKRKYAEVLAESAVMGKLNFGPDVSLIEDALNATSVQKARAILKELPPAHLDTDVAELLQHLPQEPDLFDEAEYNDVSLAVVQSINEKFKEATGSPLSFLPLLSFKHIREGDSAGGYHLESPRKPVRRVVENPKTGVYGGTFGHAQRSKFSSFFPGDLNTSIRDIQQAYKKPLVLTPDGLIGRAADGSYIQILIAPWAVVARTAFPLIEYVPGSMPKDKIITLKHVDEAHNTPVVHKYTASELRVLAVDGNPAELDLKNNTIMDVAAILTRRPEARGVYVELPSN